METVYILQIITIGVSILTIFINGWVSLSSVKKQNVANIVTAQRLENLNQYRILSSNLISLCNPLIIKNNWDNSYLETVKKEENKLKIIFKTVYQAEMELVDSLEDMVTLAYDYYFDKNNKELEQNLIEKIDKLYDKINTYDLAYWRYIINQSEGKSYDQLDFDHFWEESKSEYKKNKKLLQK